MQIPPLRYGMTNPKSDAGLRAISCHIMPRRNIPQEQHEALAAQQRQQVGAALALGAIVLVVILYRAVVHGMFTPGWWRIW